MIYVCVPTRNHGATLGLLLWKVRQVFSDFTREYHLLVTDDCSTDATGELLEPYQRALPLSVLKHTQLKGYAASVEALLREAVRRSDRPKRDCAIIIQPDFAISPDSLPELIRRIESGADLVIGEVFEGQLSLSERMARRGAHWLLRPGLNLPGVRDLLSGFCAFRLITLKRCLRDQTEPLLESDGWSANAELLARAALMARQIAVVSVSRHRNARGAFPRQNALSLARDLYRAGRRLKIPTPEVTVQRIP